jgi:hypothetical protein
LDSFKFLSPPKIAPINLRFKLTTHIHLPKRNPEKITARFSGIVDSMAPHNLLILNQGIFFTMKKSKKIKIIVIATIVVVTAVSAILLSGMLNSFFSSTGPQGLTDASVVVSFRGGYNSETGIFNLEVTAQNMGKKDAHNSRVEVTFFNVDTQVDIKTEIVTIGDVPAESSKDISVPVQIPSGLTLVSYRSGNLQWD